MAAAKSDNRALEMLLGDPRNKADVNAVVKSDARTALHICVVKRNLEGVELLLGQRDIEVNFELRSYLCIDDNFFRLLIQRTIVQFC